MDDESRPAWLKWGLGAVGLGAIAGSAAISLWVAVAILVLALLLFGGYFLFRWWSRRSKGDKIIRGVGQEAGQGLSEAERRAQLDSLLQKFRSGLKEFDRAGYSVYQYPWFVVIGESGAGKTEAVRSALADQVPASVRHHIPPPDKGTKDFVWWFTKHGIVLDTAGSMVGEGGDETWKLFLKSLRKFRPRCPINGLLVALSAESLIKNSKEQISEKATQLAAKIEMMQSALEVRFPVYMVVTKCDLLTGFREFTQRIEDPELQNQMFGWSNPAELDERFEPKAVGEYLESVIDQVKRRRLALLRPADGQGRLGDTSFFAKGYQLGQTPPGPQKMDEHDALFAFPESLMRLEPRLKRYLELIFVGDDFSSKPVFLRGIYFTSAMQEGQALDEAMSLITGASLEQVSLGSGMERKKQSFFLRDLFIDKVAPEKGLVTRAKNTLKVLRQQQLLIFGSAAIAMLLLLGFAWFGYRKLDQSARAEVRFWKAAADSARWQQGEWSPAIIKSAGGAGYHYLYAGDDPVPGFEGEKPKVTVLGFHARLQDLAEKPLHVPLIFRAVSIFTGGPNKNRVAAQRTALLGGVIEPLFNRTRDKMRLQDLNTTDTAALQRHQEALLELVRLEGAALKPSTLDASRTEGCFRALLSYLTETNAAPDTNLVRLVAQTYREKDAWPPKTAGLFGGGNLASNPAIDAGLKQVQKAADNAAKSVGIDVTNLDRLVAALWDYNNAELQWASKANCDDLATLKLKHQVVASNWNAIGSDTNLSQRYVSVSNNAARSSASPIAGAVSAILAQVPDAKKAGCIVKEVDDRLQQFGKDAVDPVTKWYTPGQKGKLEALDRDLLAGSPPSFESRWRLYTNACALGSSRVSAIPEDIGTKWQRFQEMMSRATGFEKELQAYNGPLLEQTRNACKNIGSQAVRDLKSQYVQSYSDLVSKNLRALAAQQDWNAVTIVNARSNFAAVVVDLAERGKLEPEDQAKIEPLTATLSQSKKAVLGTINANFANGVGFPLRLDGGTGTPAKIASDLVRMRALTGTLVTELNDPVWQGTEGASVLRDKCKFYDPILNMLVAANGVAVDWKLSFIAPAPNSPDADIVTVFRNLQISGMPQIPDLSTLASNKEIGAAKADAGLSMEFRKQWQDQTPAIPPLKVNDWWVARLLAQSCDLTWQGESAYRFKILLEDKDQKLKGNLTFEVSPKDPTIRLPKLTDWKAGPN